MGQQLAQSATIQLRNLGLYKTTLVQQEAGMYPDDITPLRNVQNITQLDAVAATNASPDKQQKEKKGYKSPHKAVRDYFHPLSKAVEATNQRLLERNLPYRFHVFKRWGDVFIEQMILDESGAIKSKQQKNISHDDFNRIIDDVVSIEGLFFDHRA